MDDFIEFMKIVAQSPPQLSIALIGMAIRDAWLQIACFGVIAGGSAILWRKWRKYRQHKSIEWHELLAKPVPEPHKALVIDEEALGKWHDKLVSVSGIAFTAAQARKLYQLHLDKKIVQVHP